MQKGEPLVEIPLSLRYGRGDRAVILAKARVEGLGIGAAGNCGQQGQGEQGGEASGRFHVGMGDRDQVSLTREAALGIGFPDLMRSPRRAGCLPL